MKRRLPVGAEVVEGGVHFRVWAPERRNVDVMIDGRAHPLTRDESGYFAGRVEGAREGTLYRYRLDGDGQFPDPASRHQPEGPHGPSRVVDPSRFAWTAQGWKGISAEDAVLYEMHVGTFTREGTWAAASERLGHLAELGITLVEMMPVNDFAGRWGWGYDGVNLFAPARIYGAPDDLRRFVDRAHALGMGVILDVVYNHLGPDGNYLSQYARDYFSSRFETDWGEAINYDSAPVREYFLSNVRHWIDEYRLGAAPMERIISRHFTRRSLGLITGSGEGAWPSA
jgi:maltooligosyltrehalose trehalohydrolase